MADEALLASVRAYPAKLAATGFQFSCPSIVHALPAILPRNR
jgi:NAD dependent epimerase/dehydratase family enzyme